MSLIKICGLRSQADIEMINRLQPDYAGFICNFEKSFRSLSLDQVQALTKNLSPNIQSVGVFVDEDVQVIIDALDKGIIQMAQLHGHESKEDIQAIQKAGYPVIKAFTIHHLEDVQEACDSVADYILLDQGKGEGKVFDWSLIQDVNRPYFLAGGIDTNNIEQALALHPYAIDVSSGVETNKRKDETKVEYILQKGRAYE